jgi:hypothetical protein
VILAIAVIVVLAAGGGDGGGGVQGDGDNFPDGGSIAEQKVFDLQQAADAAGCELKSSKGTGRGHTTDINEKVNYKDNPPTNGRHYEIPAEDGLYNGAPPPDVALVHALEHGRVEYQYRPGTSPAVVAQLTSLMKEPVPNQPGGTQSGGYLQLLFQNPTGMPYAVAATAWTHSITCPTFKGAATLAALRAFRAAYINKGPEFIPVPE